MRVVSLVPSLTETLFALGLGPDEVVGRTAFCIAPAPEVERVRVVGGTKTPSVRSILDVSPDLVLMEREENGRGTWDELRSRGVPTLAFHVRAVADVPPLLRSLGEAVGRAGAGEEMALKTEAQQERAAACAGRHGPGPVVFPLIWHDPLMGVGPERYAGDLVRSVGLRIPPVSSATGYPELSPEQLGALGVDVLLLTSEPHDFTEEEGARLADAVAAAGHPRPHPLHVDGQALTWFGARTASALAWWITLRERLVGAC